MDKMGITLEHLYIKIKGKKNKKEEFGRGEKEKQRLDLGIH